MLPIVVMTLGSIILLALLAAFLIACFDWVATTREQHMVQQGFDRQVEQFAEIIVPQTNWDKAIEKLDHTMDFDFADINFGTQLYTFSGFTRTFLIDGDGVIKYASSDGVRTSPDAVAAFSEITKQLLVPIRRTEALRPPIKPSPNANAPVTQPIQASGVTRAEGQVFIVIATLIQPDLGMVLPSKPRSPVVITAMPINSQMLNAFAARYLLDDIELKPATFDEIGKAQFRLESPSGKPIAALSWAPRRPGAVLYRQWKWPFLGGLLFLALVGVVLVRRTHVIIDELICSEKQSKHLAYHDQLTGVPNRSMLFEQLPVLMKEIGATYPFLAVLCIDLDRFKEVNDTLGHQAGDDLLKALAARLRIAAEPAENFVIARLGGDEFVLVYPVLTKESAERLARRCLETIMQPVESDYGRIDPGASIGVAIVDDPGHNSPSAVLRHADMALYQAKAHGRGQVAFFEPEMEDAFIVRRTIEEGLRASLQDDAFHMVYQPQVDVKGHVRSVEALLRWRHPELGEISPAVFIPLAEETGMVMAIGEIVLRRVFAETTGWSDLRVAINVSAIQMRTPGFATQVMQLAAHAGIDPSRYEIELTETALLQDGPATSENFDILRRLGFSIVLDDFGTGYSSHSLLHRFRFDRIKIDRSFVREIADNAEVAALVSVVVRLARAFRLGVIAEGVETEQQRDRLIGAGCTDFQGYLTGRPMAPDKVAALFSPASAARLQA